MYFLCTLSYVSTFLLTIIFLIDLFFQLSELIYELPKWLSATIEPQIYYCFPFIIHFLKSSVEIIQIFVLLLSVHIKNKGTTLHNTGCRILSIGSFLKQIRDDWQQPSETLQYNITLRAPVTHRIRRHKLAGVDVAVETGWEGIIMLSNQLHIHKKSQL